jgi:HAD superfamily hydrolase (TIGR01509 family)
MIKAVLFDLDGVLIETRKLHYFAFHQALEELTGLSLSKEIHDLHLDGLPTKSKLEKIAVPFGLSPEQLKQINQRKQEITLELLEKENFSNQENLSVIEWLRSKNIQLGVCSNTIRSTMDLILKRIGIQEHLHIILSSGDVKEPKPSPEIYLLAMSKLSVLPSETLIIEDSLPGLESAFASKANVQPIKGPHELNIKLLEKWI